MRLGAAASVADFLAVILSIKTKITVFQWQKRIDVILIPVINVGDSYFAGMFAYDVWIAWIINMTMRSKVKVIHTRTYNLYMAASLCFVLEQDTFILAKHIM